MHHCMWWEEPCGNAGLPTPTVTGHYLCTYHLAMATARVRDAQHHAQQALAQAQAIPVAPVTVKRGWPVGRWLPPVLFACAVIITPLTSFGPNPFTGLFMLFTWLVLVPSAWWGWQWGMGKSRNATPGKYFG